MAHAKQPWQAELVEIPLGPVTAGIGLSGLCLVLLVEFLRLSVEMTAFGLALMFVALGTWLLSQRFPEMSRWFLVLATCAAVLEFSRWLHNPIALVLLSFPLGLAATLIEPWASLGIAVPLALLALAPASPYAVSDLATLAFAILTNAASLSLLWYVRHRTRQTQAWLEEYFGSHQRLLDEARNRKAELEQSRSDWMHAGRQLALANERLAQLRLDAEQARAEKADFVAKVSHEFRTPLNVIIGMVGLMVDATEVYGAPLPPKAMEHLRIVHRNCEHLATLIDDVLDLSQSEAGRMAIRREPVDMRKLVGAAMEAVRPLAEHKHLDIGISLANDIPIVQCDGARIRQVVLNLLSNAARYTDKGRVSVTLSRGDQQVRVAVADTGPGIPAEEHARIFEPFARGGRMVLRGHPGSGMGLAVSNELVRLHGGRMWVDSTPGLGSTFYFELPIEPPAPLPQPPAGRIVEDWIWRQRATWADLSDLVARRRIVVFDEDGALSPALRRHGDQAELLFAQSLHEAASIIGDAPAHALLVTAPTPEAVWSRVAAARAMALATPIVGCCWSAPPDPLKSHAVARYLTKPVLEQDLEEAFQSLNRPINRVLIADDDPDTREWLRTALKARFAVKDVLIADSGKAALDLARREQPDVLLLDVVMPGLGGWEVLAELEHDDSLGDISVVMISAHDLVERPQVSELVMATLDGGLPADRVLALSALFSSLSIRAA